MLGTKLSPSVVPIGPFSLRLVSFYCERLSIKF
jgi:hypothetical protein